jgi:hypothetical protein
MDVVEIYRRAFELFKVNYVIAVPFIVAYILMDVVAYLFGGFWWGGVGFGGNMSPSTFRLGAMLGAALIMMLLSLVLSTLAQGMAIGMCREAIEEGLAHLESGLKVISSRIVGLLIAAILVSILVVMGFILFIIPGLVIGFFLMFTIIALVLEDLDAISAMGRSYRVVRANIGDAFVYALILIAIQIITWILGIIVGFIPIIGALVSSGVSGLTTGYTTLAGVIFFREATT